MTPSQYNAADVWIIEQCNKFGEEHRHLFEKMRDCVDVPDIVPISMVGTFIANNAPGSLKIEYDRLFTNPRADILGNYVLGEWTP